MTFQQHQNLLEAMTRFNEENETWFWIAKPCYRSKFCPHSWGYGIRRNEEWPTKTPFFFNLKENMTSKKLQSMLYEPRKVMALQSFYINGVQKYIAHWQAMLITCNFKVPFPPLCDHSENHRSHGIDNTHCAYPQVQYWLALTNFAFVSIRFSRSCTADTTC